MQEILVDRGQLVLEHDVEPVDGFGVAGNAGVRVAGLGATPPGLAAAAARGFSSSIFSIVSWHRPQFFLTLQ